MDCGVTYMNAPPPEPGELFGVWDELQMGRQHRAQRWVVLRILVLIAIGA